MPMSALSETKVCLYVSRMPRYRANQNVTIQPKVRRCRWMLAETASIRRRRRGGPGAGAATVSVFHNHAATKAAETAHVNPCVIRASEATSVTLLAYLGGVWGGHREVLTSCRRVGAALVFVGRGPERIGRRENSRILVAECGPGFHTAGHQSHIGKDGLSHDAARAFMLARVAHV